MYKCRACLVKCEEDEASNMDLLDKLSAFSDVTIADVLSEISGISITPHPHQPSKICSSCLCRLQDAYLFIIKVQESAEIINHVQVKVEREVGVEMNDETQSNCLKVVRPIKTYSVPVQSPPSNYRGKEFVDNVEIKQENVVRCVCQNFQKVDGISDKVKSIIQEKISNMQNIRNSYIKSVLHNSSCKSTVEKKITNMQNFKKNLYIKSLMHVCKCGADSTSGKNSNELEKIIYTLEFNDTYISVSRDTFIQVFDVKQTAMILLENLVLLKNNNVEGIIRSTSNGSIKRVPCKYNAKKINKSTSKKSVKKEMDERERRKLIDALMKKYCVIKPGAPPTLKEVLTEEMKQLTEEEKARRRKDLARERTKRCRERKRSNAPEKVKQWLMVSEIPGPSYNTSQPLNNMVQEETVMDEMKDETTTLNS